MRVAVPFTELHEHTLSALGRFAPDAEFFDVTSSDTAYPELIRCLWREGHDFAVVEHDIEIHAGVLTEFAICPQPWCAFVYDHGPNGQGKLMPAMGCTRFRKELLRGHPTAPCVRGTWRNYDSVLKLELTERGFALHEHRPAVLHHHAWQS